MTIGRVLRQNAFLVAAVALPLLVVLFFLVATVVPAWFVTPPSYDLLFRATEPYSGPNSPEVFIDYQVRDSHVVAIVRKVEKNSWPQSPGLYLYEHQSGDIKKITVDLPRVLPEEEAERTVVVKELETRRVLDQRKAPDGYELKVVNQRSPGIAGEIFGMGRYDSGIAITNSGRTIRIRMPSGAMFYSPDVIGWLE